MTPTPRMRKALQQVEARRIELERAIVKDLEERFFSEPGPDIRDGVMHLGLEDHFFGVNTENAGQFSMVWTI